MQVRQVYLNLQQTVNPAARRRKTVAGCRNSANSTVPALGSNLCAQCMKSE